jgi:4-hydroxy-tetrahydrodipicolinate synthase
MTEIGRVLTAMVTPFHDDGSVNYAAAGRIANLLLESGSEGLVVAGTTGEGPALSHEEKLTLFGAVKEAVGDRGAVVAGTGTYNTRESVELTREAELDADAFLLTVPYYVKPPQEGLYAHFEAIAGATSKPCIMYNIPSRTSVNMTAETTIRLSEIANIAGIKEASGDIAQVAAIVEGARPGFRVWSGNDEDTLAIVRAGGYGVVGVITHLVGRQVLEMVELAAHGRIDEAEAIHRRIMPLRDAMFSATSPIPIKWSLRRLGLPVGPLRLPLIDPEPDVAEAIWAEVTHHQLDLPVEEPVHSA